MLTAYPYRSIFPIFRSMVNKYGDVDIIAEFYGQSYEAMSDSVDAHDVANRPNSE